MAEHSTKRRRLSPKAAKHLPYPDFPLSPHLPTGRWYKVIRGKRHYFGKLDDPDAAIALYELQREDLYVGRRPRLTPATGVKVADVVNGFLDTKRANVDSGEMAERSWLDLYDVGRLIVEAFGRDRVVSDLCPEDFAQFRASLASKVGPVRVGNQIQRCRSIFKWASDTDLIDRPVKFGPDFKKPKRLAVRRVRQSKPKRMFAADELRAIIDAADVPLRAMTLLGINAALGNTDIAMIPRSAVDLDACILDWPRPKTAIDRRAILWPETVEAILDALAARPDHHDKADADLIFITKYGRRWVRENIAHDDKGKPKLKRSDGVGLQFGKLLRKLDLKRDGLNFYALRHTFQTVAEQTRDFPAVERIAGREDAGQVATMYREDIGDDRLKAVANHVHDWLWPEENQSNDD